MNLKKKILISGYYGFDNSGDDAILKAIVKDLKEKSDNIEIVAFSNNPSNTEKNYGIKAVDRFRMKNVLEEVRTCDLLISGGGSLLQDVTSTRSIVYYLALMNLAKFFKKPVMVYANGIGPINKKYNRLFTKKILNKVDLITLRDYDSKKFVEGLGVENPNIVVTADPVFTLSPSSKDRIEEIFKTENIPFDKPLVGISLRKWKDSKRLIEVIPKAIDYIISNYNANVVFIPMHYPEDLKISQEIMDMVTREGCYILKDKYCVEDIMGIIRELEMIIAMRLHSLIYAATQGTPMLGIIYDPKIEGFLNFIDMDLKCNVEDLELIELCTYTEKMWKNRKYLREKLLKYDVTLKEKALQNIDMALGLLKRR